MVTLLLRQTTKLKLFLTLNTADLRTILESIQNDLPYKEEVFEKDFLEILNSNPEEDMQEDMTSYICDK